MTVSLENRFQQFVTTLPGYENIDEIISSDSASKKHADYLFAGHAIIVEQKTLKIDPKDKAQRFVERLVRERGIVLFGTHSIQRVLQGLPDGNFQYRRFIHKLTAQIEEAVSKADKQIRATREIVDNPNAAGILVLLNEGANSLIPELIRYRLFDLFKRHRDGSARFSAIDVVVVINECHPTIIGDGKFHRVEGYNNPVATNLAAAVAFTDELKAKWAVFGGSAPYVGQILHPKAQFSPMWIATPTEYKFLEEVHR